MAIEKGLYAAPESIEGIDGELMEPELEIEVINPEMVTLDDGSVEITIIPGGDEDDLLGFDANLVEAMDEGELTELADDLIGMVDADVEGRREWAETYVKGLDILGFKTEERTTPWEGACGAYRLIL